MVYILFILSSIVLTVLVLRKRSLERQHAKHTITGPNGSWVMQQRNSRPPRSLRVIEGLLEFFVPFTVVSLLYSLIQLYLVCGVPIAGSTTTLRSMEEGILFLQKGVAKVRLAGWWPFILMVLLVAFQFYYPTTLRFRLIERYKKYSKIVTRAYIALTLAAAFTFFGSAIDKSVQPYEARLADSVGRINTGFAKARDEVRRIVEHEVAAAIVEDTAFAPILGDVARVVTEAVKANMDYTAVEAKSSQLADLGFARQPIPRGIDRPGPSFRPGPPFTPNSPASEPPPLRQTDLATESTGSLRKLEIQIHEVKAEAARPASRSLHYIVEESANAVHSETLKPIIVEMLPQELQGIADIALDADVLYNFNEVVTDVVDRVWNAPRTQRMIDRIKAQREYIRGRLRAAYSEIQRARERLRTSFAKWQTRADVSALLRRKFMAEIDVQIRTAIVKERQEFIKWWDEQYSLEFRPGVGTAVRQLRTSVLAEIDASTDPGERLEAIREARQKFEGITGGSDEDKVSSLAVLEEEEFHRDHIKRGQQSAADSWECSGCGYDFFVRPVVGGACPSCKGEIVSVEYLPRTGTRSISIRGFPGLRRR